MSLRSDLHCTLFDISIKKWSGDKKENKNTKYLLKVYTDGKKRM